MLRFEGRAAIVTGGGGGIGRAIALRLAREGAHLAVADIRNKAARDVAEEIRAEGGAAEPVEVDVTSAASANAMVDAAINAFQQVDVLVSNAGWDKAMPFMQTDEDFWDRIIAVNYRGHLACTRAVLPHMIERGGGSIVTIASDAGRVGSTGETVYAGAKGGVIAFTKSLAREMARHRIRVNCVAPGLVDTPLLGDITAGNPKLVDAILHSIPMRRFGAADEIAAAVAFLASDTDAAYITGQTLSVNGGLTMM